MQDLELIHFLTEKAAYYEQPAFIANDPICIPHHYTQQQDIEISALFAATLAWGSRTTIINNCRKLMQLMDDAPYQFIRHHNEKERSRFLHFVHRTFNATDLLVFIDFLQKHYQKNDSLEQAFTANFSQHALNIEPALNYFFSYFFPSGNDYPLRTQKHVAAPAKKSSCKRLNMFLRWMVRSADKGVDFGVWHTISPAQLICPIDVHVGRVSQKLGLIQRKQIDWHTAIALTNALREIDPHDPVKFDYALFGLGVSEGF